MIIVAVIGSSATERTNALDVWLFLLIYDRQCFYFIHQIQCFSPLPTFHNSVVAVITLHGYTCSQLVAAKHFSHHFRLEDG